MKKIVLSLFFMFAVCAQAETNSFVIDKDFSKKNIDPIYQGHNEIILTIDDGPTAGVTDKILDILADYGVKATFFVVGTNVKRYPELMNRIVAEGHIVGNHSMSHLALKDLDPLTWKDKVREEVMDAHQLILPYMVNNRHYFFRAPEGAWAEKFADFLNEDPIGKEYVGPLMWDIGGELEMKNGKYITAADWACWSKKVSVNDCLNGYLSEAQRRKGGVILMHDLRRQSVELLSKMIPELQDRGFIFTDLNAVNF